MSNVRSLEEYRQKAYEFAGPAAREVGVGRRMFDPDPMAPWPSIDRYPNILGAGLTLSYISSVIRLCLTGYRQQYVDLLEELLSLDPHCFSVISKRVLAIGQGKLEFVPPDSDKLPTRGGGTIGETDNKRNASAWRCSITDPGEQEIAKEIAAWVQSEVDQIPDLSASLTQLAWALFYSVSTLEKMLVRRDDGSLGITALNFIHYRRLSYPDPWRWDLYVWDQGLVTAADYGMAPTNQGVFGLNTSLWREKFIIHTPQVCGSYPTRDGLGRELVYWMAIKHIAARLAPQHLEKFGIPITDVEYNTKGGNVDAPDQPRIANNDDIALAKVIAQNMGGGGGSYFDHPDSIKAQFLVPQGRTPMLTFEGWISLCNSEESKAASGGTLTTEVTHTGGNRAVAQEQGKREEKLYQYDAGRMASTMKRDVGDFLVHNNPRFRGVPQRLLPQCVLHVNDDPDPMDEIERATKAAQGGIPVDADAMAKRVRLPLVPNPNGDEPRRMIPIMPVKISVPNEVLGLPDPPEPPPAPNAPPGAAAPNAPPGAETEDQPEEDKP